jgi:dipeptidyl aminopeptidase/acylaminoacyl peptidase
VFLVKQDRRKVPDLFVVNALSNPRPTLETYKYSMPGEKNIAQDELIVIDVKTKELVNIDVKKWKDQSIGGVYFYGGGGLYPEHRTSDKLYFLRRDRTWSKIDVCVADTKTGETNVLIEEESKPYFNTRYATLLILNDGEDLVWWSERDGLGHLYHYDGNGRLINRITRGNFVVGNISAIDSTTNTLYFSAFGKEKDIDPYYNMYYKVDINGRNFQLLTPENATHSFSMPEKKRDFFVDTYSRINQAPKTVLRDKDGKVVLDLETTDIARLLEAGWKMPETFTVKAADGVTDLYGVMWKPFDFNPNNKYPLITYVYPGPQSEPVPKPFTLSGSRGRNVALAQLGFVVVAVGNRGGSPQRSKYYHNWGYGNNRDYPLDDNKAALEQLANRHAFIDISKIGIYGHSGGGNMSTAAMFKYPDFYKVAVSSAGNHDNNIYNIWWGEVHYGVKEVKKKQGNKKGEEKEAAQDSTQKEKITFTTKIDNNQSLAKNLKGHLLLVHGDIDNNVHPGNTIRVVDALIKAGKRFDFMIMPGKRHGFGNYQSYFEKTMWYYFAEHLLGDYRTNVEIKNFVN